MLKPTHSRLVHRPAESRLIPLYAVILLLIFHSTITVYINSSYLNQFISEAAVGTIYLTGSAVGLVLFLLISRVLHRVGNFKLTISLLVFDFFAVLAMGFVNTAELIIPLFLIHFVSLPIIFFNFDVFLESEISNRESTTGSKRGLLLTLGSLVAIISTIVMGISIPESGDFTPVYILSALSVIPVIILMWINLKDFTDPPYQDLDILAAMRSFWERKNIRLVFLATFFLQLFFTFTVIYYPIYLTRDIGLSWEDFGIMMAIAVLAYLIFEYPIGIIADKYIGEKEMMATGFMMIALTVASTSFITSSSLVLWSTLMFVTRIGASLVETTTESYFFKKTRSSDAQIISFFRASRPLAYIVTALFGSLLLIFIPFNLLFITAALAMIPGMFFALNLEDTK